MAMTASQHFEKAEELLEKAADYHTDQKSLYWATRAQAHLNAARLLLDIEKTLIGSNYPTEATNRTGLAEIAQKRRTNS